jgi:hypothetical protein
MVSHLANRAKSTEKNAVYDGLNVAFSRGYLEVLYSPGHSPVRLNNSKEAHMKRSVMNRTALLLFVLSLFTSAIAQPQDPQRRFQYAIKFVCGLAKGDVAVQGNYLTAINLHNPLYDKVTFLYKVAVALPGLKEGKISPFKEAVLGPDGAAEIDCPDIWKITGDSNGKWVKGFVVIETNTELDVVGVYTSKETKSNSITLDVERYSPRVRQAAALSDLIPVPDANLNFCQRTEQGLQVTFKNQGLAASIKTKGKVDFNVNGATVTAVNAIPALVPGASVTLNFPIPLGCFGPDCAFTIMADHVLMVPESNEINNTASGTCLG